MPTREYLDEISNQYREANSAKYDWSVYDKLFKEADALGVPRDLYAKQVLPNVDDPKVREAMALNLAEKKGLPISSKQVRFAAGTYEPNILDNIAAGLGQHLVSSPAQLGALLSPDTLLQGALGDPLGGTKRAAERSVGIREALNKVGQADIPIPGFGLGAEELQYHRDGGYKPVSHAVGELAGYVPYTLIGGPAALLSKAGIEMATATVAQKVAAGMAVNVAQTLPIDFVESIDADGKIDTTKFYTAVGFNAAAGGIVEGIAGGLVRGNKAKGVLKGAGRKAEADGLELMDEMSVRRSSAQQEQAQIEGMQQAQKEQRTAEVFRQFPEESHLIKTPEYEAGVARIQEQTGKSIDEYLAKTNLPEPAKVQIRELTVAKMHEQFSPKEIVDQTNHMNLTAKKQELVAQLNQEGDKFFSMDFGRLKQAIDVIDGQLEKIKLPDIYKKIGNTIDTTMKDADKLIKGAANPPAKIPEVPEKFPEFEAYGKKIETAGKKPVEIKQPSKDLYVSKRTSEIEGGKGIEGSIRKDLTKAKTPELKTKLEKEFDKLNSARNELYKDYRKAKPENKSKIADGIKDIERKLYMSTKEGKLTEGVALKPTDTLGGKGVFPTAKLSKLADTEATAQIGSKTKGISLEQATKLRPDLETRLEGFKDKNFKTYIEENIGKYDLNDKSLYSKLNTDYRKTQSLAKTEREFAKALENPSMRKQINAIKDPAYKTYVANNIVKYNAKDPKVLGKIRKAYIKEKGGHSAFHKANADKLKKGDPKAVEKAVDEIKESRKLGSRKQRTTDRTRCK